MVDESFRVSETIKALDRREIWVVGEVDEHLIELVVMQINKYNNEDAEFEEESKSYKRSENPIIVYISTVGGCADTMFACVGAMLRSKTPIVTQIVGRAWSAGFIMFLAGHVRISDSKATFMCHSIAYGRSGELQKHEDTLNVNKKFQEKINNFILERTKIPKKKLDEITKSKHDWYIFGDDEEILKYKIAHAII